MCGRYTITITDVADYFKAEQGSFEFAPSYNVAPTQQVPIVLEREGKRVMTPAKWDSVGELGQIHQQRNFWSVSQNFAVLALNNCIRNLSSEFP